MPGIIEGALTFGTALSSLITKSLPSDEQKLQQLKNRYPLIYFRIRNTIHRRAFRYLYHHREVGVQEYINFVGGGMTAQERIDLSKVLNEELNKIQK